jgi:hypothetical protein
VLQAPISSDTADDQSCNIGAMAAAYGRHTVSMELVIHQRLQEMSQAPMGTRNNE